MDQLARPTSEATAPLADTAPAPPVVLALARPVPSRRRRGILALLAIALLLPAGIIVLYAFPPTDDSWYPRCFLHSTTGIHCPGCGSTRALHAAFHGHILQALAYNIPVFIFLPTMLYIGLRTTYALIFNRPDLYVNPPTWAMRAFFWFIILYFIVRNIPIYPFNMLAPDNLASLLGPTNP
jgi:hypothetical protein